MNYELDRITRTYNKLIGPTNELLDRNTGSIVINEDKVLSINEINGLHIEYNKITDGVEINIHVDAGIRINDPVHLCVGMLPSEGRQVIRSRIYIHRNAYVKFLAHCIFQNAKHIEHIMDSEIYLEDNAEMIYKEEHFNSDDGEIYTYPKVIGKLGNNSKLSEEFKLIHGRAGDINIDYDIKQNEKSSCDIMTKIFGKKKDNINIKESLYLNGPYASGTATSRIVLIDNAKSNVFGEIAGNAPYTRGHVDCQEVISDGDAYASATPKISVNNPLSQITHEASIGRVNKKELETLMAHGISKDEAIQLIVRGILR